MPGLVEAKSAFIYWGAKTFGERFIEYRLPKLDLTGIEQTPTNPLLEEARDAYANFRAARTPTEKAVALLNLSQKQIDMSYFPAARRSLTTLEELTRDLRPNDQAYYQAAILVKKAWIADYETGYLDEIGLLQQAQTLLATRYHGPRTQREEDLQSTVTHFMGRAHLGRANQGINPQENAAKAYDYFNHDQPRFERLRQQGESKPANEGFQHLWKSVCNLAFNNIEMAQAEVETANQLFNEHLIDNPKSGIRGHYFLVQGLIALQQREPQTATGHFLESARIRTDVENYPMGLALALTGASRAQLSVGNYLRSLNYFMQAFKTQPAILLYACNGRLIG